MVRTQPSQMAVNRRRLGEKVLHSWYSCCSPTLYIPSRVLMRTLSHFKFTFRNDIISILGLDSGYKTKYSLRPRELPLAQAIFRCISLLSSPPNTDTRNNPMLAPAPWCQLCAVRNDYLAGLKNIPIAQ